MSLEVWLLIDLTRIQTVQPGDMLLVGSAIHLNDGQCFLQQQAAQQGRLPIRAHM